MSIQVYYSEKRDASSAIAEIREKSSGVNAKAVVYFASSIYDPSQLSSQMSGLFPNAAVFGCSTAGEIVSGKVLKNSLAVMVLGPDKINDVHVALVENIKTENKVSDAFRQFENYFGTPMQKMDITKYVGIILTDGMQGAEEKLMERIGDLTDVTFIGAAAGDDLQFKSTTVYANGKSYTNAAVLALLKPAVGFDFLKTQSFYPMNEKLVATKVNEAARTVVEFNKKPASEAYAEALGISAGEASKRFMTNPIGLMIGNEPYVRSPQQIQGKDMVFYCNVKEGMELSLLQSTDIVNDTKEALKAKVKEMGSVSGIINFHCILRTLELEQKNQTAAYGKIFSDIPTIGFSTYGEEFIGHINQTSTMLLFR